MDAGRVKAYAVPAALLGGAACVSCTVSLVAAVGAAAGVGAISILGLSPLVLGAASLVLVGSAVGATLLLRRSEAACAVPPARSPYLTFRLRHAVLGLLLAAATVAGVALLAEQVVERVTPVDYVIHWTTTVPALVGAFAWVFHGELNKRRDG